MLVNGIFGIITLDSRQSKGVFDLDMLMMVMVLECRTLTGYTRNTLTVLSPVLFLNELAILFSNGNQPFGFCFRCLSRHSSRQTEKTPDSINGLCLRFIHSYIASVSTCRQSSGCFAKNSAAV